MPYNSQPTSLSVQNTPMKDRDRLPFPQSSQPSPAPSLRQTTSSAATASFTNLPSTATPSAIQASPQTITVEGLLKQYASSSDPKAAALDQAVNDRNVLSAQNSQLWKLIEKQRAGYNQILKELERIRGERDSYKARLNGGTSDKRRKTSSERTSRPSIDTISSQTSSASVSASVSPLHTRQPMARHNSDDTANATRNPQLPVHHQLHPSRSFDPIAARSPDNAMQSNNAYTLSNPPSITPPAPPQSAPTPMSTRQYRPSPSPLVVPTRSDSHPSASPATPESTTSYRQPISGDSITTNPGIYPPTTRPLAHPRKTSLADSFSSIVTSGSNLSASSPSTSVSSTSFNNYGPNIPPGFTNGPLVADSQPTRPRNTRPSLDVTTPTNTSQSAMQQAQSQLHPHMLTLTESRPPNLSRESRISLPDEARQYIANMADSPLPSPRVDNFSPKSRLATSVFPPLSNGVTSDSGTSSEFLDLDEEESEDDSDGEGAGGDVTAGVGDPSFDSLRPALGPQQQQQAHDPSLYRPPQPEYMNPYSSQSNSSREDLDSSQAKKKEKSRVGAEEFPLPPPSNNTNIYPQRQQSLGPDGQYYGQNANLSQQSLLAQQQQQQASSMQVPASSPSKQPQSMSDQYAHGSLSGGGYAQPSMQVQQQESSSTTSFNSGASSNQVAGYESQASLVQSVPAAFRALPLLSSDLPHTSINVSHSFVRPNDRGKEVLSFIVFVNAGNGKEGWKVEKMYSDVLSLDQRVRNSVGKGVGKKIANLPEGKLWKDHAPAKVDQRKAVLENYLQTLIQLPVKNNDEVIAFFTSDIVREEKQPVMQAGHKEGYLTKRGKNFGGWKTRFFVLQGPVLEYYDCRGGAHLGSITITGAQIARQHRTEKPPTTDDEKEYRHAFLIVESKKGPGGNHPRHVLCAESDEDRDSWVEMLVRYYTGTYSEDLVFNPASGLTSVQQNTMALPRSSTSSSADIPSPVGPRSSSKQPPARGMLREEIARGPAVSVPPTQEDYTRSSSPSRSMDPSPIDRQGPSPAGDAPKRSGLGLPSSLPDSSPLSSGIPTFQVDQTPSSGQRANSELGHYPDLNGSRRPCEESRKTLYPPPSSGAPPPERVPSPEKLDPKAKISGPMNGTPIPSGFKFGAKDAPSAEASAAANDRREKAKSRSFWGFGKGDKNQPHPAFIPRAVFGVPLEEALDVAQMCNLPAIVFRSIQYLEAKKAELEEGIYRLSGSSAVIKSLKDRFNNEGDVDLLASDEYWDPHAIAGLLKSFLRELPSSILTRDLHLKFLAVIDFVDAQERIRELSQLIAALPLANYSLLRALTAHLILIVQNSNINKMTMRNVGIVFSPTLGIPAGVFSLMLGEFNRVFNVDNNDLGGAEGDAPEEDGSEPFRRNSRQYSDAAADQILGLSGRTLSTPAEETQSDGDDYSIQDESGPETTEGDLTVESSSSSSPGIFVNVPELEMLATPTSKKAASTAASKGLNVSITTSDRGNRHSRMMGLPSSPRPTNLSPSRDMQSNALLTPPRPNE